MAVVGMCSGCDVRFTGSLTAHCSRCHATFTGERSFNAHQVDGRCVRPSLSKRFWEARPGVWSHLTLKDAEKASVIPKKAHS